MLDRVEQHEDKEYIEKGLRLHALTGMAGWNDVLDIMEIRVVQAEGDLMNAAYADPTVLVALQKRALAWRTLFHVFQEDVQKAIQIAQHDPSKYPAGSGVPGLDI